MKEVAGHLNANRDDAERLRSHLLALMVRGTDALLGAWPPDAVTEFDDEPLADEDAAALTADDDAERTPSSESGDRRFRAYLSAVRDRARLDHAAEQQLFEQLNVDDAQLRAAARSKLIQANLWVVPIVVRRFYKQGSGFEDLVAEGNMGLYRALDRFDPSRGLRFSSYAKWWVMHVVTAAMSVNAYPVRVPRRVALQLARQRRSQEAPRAQASDAAPTAAALPEPLAESYEVETHEHSADDAGAASPDVMLALKEGLQLLKEALAELPARERLVIEARYGLNGQPERTLQDLGRELGMSAEGVRKVQLAAMQQLKQKLASGWL
jgi:RNA polymerase sigma factor (sigma-70 family)